MYFEICTTDRSRKNPCRAFKRFSSVRYTGGNMYRVQADERKTRKIKRICRRCHYLLKRMYPENLGRSDQYRRNFFAYYPKPAGGYRCRYCNRRLSDEKLTVDHIYPVYMAKTGKKGWMHLMGINDINDVKNLAPACRKCNLKKGRKAGIWVIKGIIGKYKLYWFLRNLLRTLLLLFVAYLVYKNKAYILPIITPAVKRISDFCISKL